MRSYLAAFLEALVICTTLTPLVRRVALRAGAISPTGGRHVNLSHVPRLGGIAIALSASAPLLTLLFVDSGAAIQIRANVPLVVALVVGGFALCAVGAWDDLRGLRARYKLALQLAAAGFAYWMGFRIEGILVPLLGPVALGVASIPVTLLWIVGVTNAVNLIDGLDGLAAGVVFFAAVTNLVVALMSAPGAETVFVALLMTSLMGALLGFLFFNFNPARIYMGDSGSYFLGFVLATTSLMVPLQKASTAVSLLVPMVALGIPIFDTLFSMVRRYLEQRPMFSADRGHLHHRLLDMGITHRRAVLSLYAVSLVFAGSAIAIALGRDWEVGLGLLGACVVLVGLVRAVGYIEYAQIRLRRFSRYRQDVVERLRRFVPVALAEIRSVESEAELPRILRLFVEELDLQMLRVVGANGTLLHEVKGTQSRADAHPRPMRCLLDEPRAFVELHPKSGEEFDERTGLLLQVVVDALGSRFPRLGVPAPSGVLSEGPCVPYTSGP